MLPVDAIDHHKLSLDNILMDFQLIYGDSAVLWPK